MSKITKPDLSIQWAQTGTVSTPTDGKKQQGWTAEKPAFEYMNWLQNRQDTGIYYTFQMGVPEWDGNTEYQYASGYASYVQYNGVVYKSIQTGTNKNPSTETAYWERAFDSYGSAATVNTALSNHITNYGTLASLSNVTTARANLSVYSIAQCDATFAPIAGNSSQTFLVGSPSSANHAARKSYVDARTGQANETTAGIAEIATQAETNAGVSDVTVVTPKKLMASNYTPSGCVMAFAGTSAPTGWLECNGSAVSRTTYSTLFSVISTTYGIGDGISTFNLPDMRGEFLRGWDHGRGVDPGRASGSNQDEEIKSHSHNLNMNPVSGSPGIGTKGVDGRDQVNATALFDPLYNYTSSTGGTETRPRNVAMMYIIKI